MTSVWAELGDMRAVRADQDALLYGTDTRRLSLRYRLEGRRLPVGTSEVTLLSDLGLEAATILQVLVRYGSYGDPFPTGQAALVSPTDTLGAAIDNFNTINSGGLRLSIATVPSYGGGRRYLVIEAPSETAAVTFVESPAAVALGLADATDIGVLARLAAVEGGA